MKINIHHLPRHRFFSTVVWSVVASAMIVIAASGLARAARNFKAALTDKPDVALFLLLPEEEITYSSLLRETPNERDYIAETKTGPKLIKLKRGPQQWYVSLNEALREAPSRDAAPAAETTPSPE